jgi:hypothetical protein
MSAGIALFEDRLELAVMASLEVSRSAESHAIVSIVIRRPLSSDAIGATPR